MSNSGTRTPVVALRRLRLMALPAVMAAAVTLVVIAESRFQGRLAGPPVYDDVAYMRDGVGRLIKLYQGGAGALARDVAAGPPHSPLQSALAATGFAVFGMTDWAPYAMNTLVALLLLGLPAYVFRRSPWPHRVLLLLAMVVLPVTVNSVHEFRPDITAAALVAWGMALALDPPGGLGNRTRPMLIGAVFGLSLLAKTSTSPVTLVLFAITALTSGLMHARPRGAPPAESLILPAREVAYAGAAVLLVAGPFYGLAWESIYHYIHVNMFGDRAGMWKRGGPPAFHLRYYLDGSGGDFMLGVAAYPLLLLALAGLAVGLPRIGARARCGAAGLALATLVAYAVCTWNPMKQGFLGLPFQLLLLLGGLLSLRRGLSMLSPPGARTLALAILAAGSLSFFRFTNPWPVAQPSFRAARTLYDEAYAAIRRELGVRPAVVLVTFTGMVNETNLEFRSLVDGLPFYGQSREEARTLADYAPFLEKAVLVLAAQSGTKMTNDAFPSGTLHDAMIDRLETGGDFRRVWAWESVTPGREFRLYRRISPPPADAPAGAPPAAQTAAQPPP